MATEIRGNEKIKLIIRLNPPREHLEEDQKCHFHCCYLLQSISNPRATYIGYTVNPFRRLRQHNGEIKGGAKHTRRNRPWRLICYITGFYNESEALQFEWRCQHPTRGLIKLRNPFIILGFNELKKGAGLRGRLRCMAQTSNLKKWTKQAVESYLRPLTLYWKVPAIGLPFLTPNLRTIAL